nr:hypothetical protein [Streptomyces sabulosicollis]
MLSTTPDSTAEPNNSSTTAPSSLPPVASARAHGDLPDDPGLDEQAGTSALLTWEAGRIAFGSPSRSSTSSPGNCRSAMRRAASSAPSSTRTDSYSTARSRARIAVLLRPPRPKS